MGKRGPKPRFIDTTWSADLAYVVGIFASDGNLGKDGMYLDVTSVDKEILENVRRILGLTVKIGKKKSGHGNIAYRIQCKRVMLHKWFMSIGLTPNKSHTIGALDVPDQFFFDFFRGVWDGDGCIYSYFDPRWKSSFMYYISIASSSRQFLEWLQCKTLSLVKVKGSITKGTRDTLQLKFAKREACIIFDNMFHQSGLPHLSRKFAKAQEIFRIDKANNKKRLVK